LKKDKVNITCSFSDESDLKEIVLRSFCVFTNKILQSDIKLRYNAVDEWSLISGGKKCT